MSDCIKIKFLLVLFILVIPPELAFGKGCTNEKIDSLQQLILTKDLDNLQKADAFLDLGACMLNRDLDSARLYAEKGFLLSEKEDYMKGLARFGYFEGKAAEIEGHYIEAKTHYSNALDLYRNLNKDETFLETCNGLAYINELQSEYDQALDWYHRGLEVSLEQNNLIYQAAFYNNIATTLMKATRYRESLQYLFLASSIFEKLGNNGNYGIVVGNIAIAYLDLLQYDSAMYFLDISGEIAKELNSIYSLLLNERSKGDVSMEQGNLSSALDHYKKSLGYAEVLGPLHPEKFLKTGWAHYFYGHALMQSKDFHGARIHLNQAKGVGDSLDIVALISESARDLSIVYEDIGLLDSALYYRKQYQAANDTMLNERYNAQLDRLIFENQAKLQQANHDSEIKLISLEKQRRELVIFILIGITVSLIILAFLVWRAQKSKIKIIERDHRLMQLESEQATMALERKKRELTSTLMDLAGRNEFVISINSRLQDLISENKSINRSQIEQLTSLLTNESRKKLWNEFELSFIEVHTKFYETLNKLFPDLTANERRICAFLFLNMSTKEISSITYQSEQSIKIARYRLRKKMGIERNANITHFLQNLS